MNIIVAHLDLLFNRHSKTEIFKKNLCFLPPNRSFWNFFILLPWNRNLWKFYILSNQKFWLTHLAYPKLSYILSKTQFFKRNFSSLFERADFLPEYKLSYTCLKNNQFFIITRKKNSSLNKEFLMLAWKLPSYTYSKKWLKWFILDVFWIHLCYFLC